jgi:hypothetical protein
MFKVFGSFVVCPWGDGILGRALEAPIGLGRLALPDHCTMKTCTYLHEVGFCHMRIGEGVNSRLQLSGLLAKLCKVVIKSQ